ncbi:MAG: O-methyltransferase [Cyclobacteriaceae bacterium]|nr:MAG: O-methyltransferase [Cyclobacteriaceae bacterium]
MNFFSPELQRYVENHTSPESALLKRLDRETNLRALYPKMISGHLQGRILAMFSQMIKPQRILEIGTFTGYSAICMAEGLVEGGELITIDINHELQDMVQQYFLEAGISSSVKCVLGDAMEVIPTLQGTFDLVYLDADKENYCNYLDLIIEKVAPGGYILADNVLWYGKVLESIPKKLDRETMAIKEFNKKVIDDPRVENVLLPVRDGLMLIRKNI